MYTCTVKLEEHLMQSRFKDETHRMNMHILVVARQVELLTRRLLQEYGISPPQYNVLRILRGQKGQPLAVQALAQRMIDPSSNTSRIVDRLVDNGWTERRTCPNDRRKADVTITKEGLSLLADLDAPLDSLLNSAFDNIPAETANALNAGLAQVLNNADALLQSNN